MQLSGHNCNLMSHHNEINLNGRPYRGTQSQDCQNQCDMPFLHPSLCQYQFTRIDFYVHLNTQANFVVTKNFREVFTATIY